MKRLIIIGLLLLFIVVPASAIYQDTFNLSVTTAPEWWLMDYLETNVSKLSSYNISSPIEEINSSYALYGSNDGYYFDLLDNRTYINWSADKQYQYDIDESVQQFYRYYVFYARSGLLNLSGKDVNITLTAMYISPFIPVEPTTVTTFFGPWFLLAISALFVIGGFWIPMSALLGVILAVIDAGMNMQNYTGNQPIAVTALILVGLLVFFAGLRSNRMVRY